MKLSILTLFPEYFEGIFNASILKRAIENKSVEVQIINIRDYSQSPHKIVDDRPYGGGAGMVMQVEPIDLALESLGNPVGKRKKILTSAKGSLFTQSKAREFCQFDELVIVCGHYEGVDERVADFLVDEEIRVGDFVLTGGEPASAVISDAVIRLLPDVLGNPDSLVGESHETPGKLGYPQYTRPENYKNWQVPEVLLSGNHSQIAEWREQNRAQTDGQDQ